MKRLNTSKAAICTMASRLGIHTPRAQHAQVNARLEREGQHKCARCGEIKPSADFYYHSRYARYQGICKACISHHAEASIRNRFRKHRSVLAGRMTVEQLEAKWEEQKGLCFYTGEQMTNQNSADTLVSIDRLDSNEPYTVENTVLCCYRINIMKNTTSVADFVAWCKKVAAFK